LEDAPKDHALVDAVRLEAVLGDIADASDRFLEDSEMELALAADVVLEHVCGSNECIFPGGKEDLGCPG
jgi:hypothetical protein